MNKTATITEAHPSGPLADINARKAKKAASTKANSDMAPPSNVAIRKGKGEKPVASFSQTLTDLNKVIVALAGKAGMMGRRNLGYLGGN